MLQKINKATAFINEKTNGFKPEFGIVMGSGLGGLVNIIDTQHTIPYSEIPGFPTSTVKGHGGNMMFGTTAGKKIVAMQGRFHYYEGYSMNEITFPIRVMHSLGIKSLILTNAAGGINTNFRVGDIMLITDHISLMPNPLIGKNIDFLGPRFPEMSVAYDTNLLDTARKIACDNKIEIHEGVYVAVTGPTYETPSEYQFYRIIGGDCVGMSTVPEVVIARHMSLPVFAISAITNLGGKEPSCKVAHEDVLKASSIAEPKMATIIKEMLKTL